MEIHLNFSIPKRKFIKIYISNELETLNRSPVFTNIIWIMLMRYQAFNIVHLISTKLDTLRWGEGEEQNICWWVYSPNSQVWRYGVWSQQWLVLSMEWSLVVGNALVYLFPLSEFDWIKCTRFQGKIGNPLKFHFLFSEFHW